MRVLIDICHPAHVHYFRNLIEKLKVNHELWVTCRETGIVLSLLRHYQIPHVVIGPKKDGLISKIGTQFLFAKKIRDIIVKKRIDIAMGVSGAAIHGALNTKAKSILFDDDDQYVQPLTSRFVSPFADTILSPDALKHEGINKAVYYPGYHELAYLHPKEFQADSRVLGKYGLSPEDKYFILRFNAFKAHHDHNEGGMTLSQKRQLIQLLKEWGRVFITTEAKLDSEFKDYKMPIAPEDIHHFLAFAQILVSDSQTMSSEAAVLGTPSFRCNSFAGRISYLEEEEKRYGLTFGFLPHQFEWMIELINQKLEDINWLPSCHLNRQRLLKDKIDVTAFWLWFIDNYPDSEFLAGKQGFDYEQFKGKKDDE